MRRWTRNIPTERRPGEVVKILGRANPPYFRKATPPSSHPCVVHRRRATVIAPRPLSATTMGMRGIQSHEAKGIGIWDEQCQVVAWLSWIHNRLVAGWSMASACAAVGCDALKTWLESPGGPTCLESDPSRTPFSSSERIRSFSAFSLNKQIADDWPFSAPRTASNRGDYDGSNCTLVRLPTNGSVEHLLRSPMVATTATPARWEAVCCL
jgi:hypothetical protein